MARPSWNSTFEPDLKKIQLVGFVAEMATLNLLRSHVHPDMLSFERLLHFETGRKANSHCSA